MSESAGISSQAAAGLGVSIADFDRDGRPDIYVANDAYANHLWVNQGAGVFREAALPRGLAMNAAGRPEAGMGLVCDDLDGDGRLDLLSTHLRGESHTLYRGLGDGQYDDVTARVGVVGPTLRFTGFGVVAPDLDLDGSPEIVIVNGHVFRGPGEPGGNVPPFWAPYAQPGQVFLGGGLPYREAGPAGGTFTSEPRVGRGLATGDIDGDGDEDLVEVDAGGPARLWLNTAPGGCGVTLRLLDPTGRVDVPGALVTVLVGDRRLVRRSGAGGSYLSSRDPRLHVGLGDADRSEGVEVVWPDGVRERFPGMPAGSTRELVRGAGEAP